MDYGDDTTTGAPSASSGMSDGMKLGILAGTLGLTGLVAWAYSDRGPLGAKKTAKGGGAPNGPTFPIGSADWAQWQSQHNPSTYGHHPHGAPGYHQDHRVQGGGAPGGPTFPIGSQDWAQWQAQHNPSTYGHAAHGAPGYGVQHAGLGYEAAHRAQGGPRTFICGGGETANVIAAKYGRSAGELVAANPNVDWNQPCPQNTQVAIPDAWPLMS